VTDEQKDTGPYAALCLGLCILYASRGKN